jgi:thiol-disulfide isomerase/thioredoxin
MKQTQIQQELMKRSILVLFSFIVLQASTQNSAVLRGSFPAAKEKEIRLMGFVGTQDTLFAQTITDTSGNFALHYPKKYKGAAILQVKEMTNLIVLINNENFEITWSNFKDFNGVQFTNSMENQVFQEAFTINMDAQKKLAGLTYLLPFYKKNFTKTELTALLELEINSESSRFEAFLNKLPNTSYAKAYLSYRTVLQNLQKENKTQAEETDAESAFLALDFSDERLFYSGLVQDFIEAYFKQVYKLENKELIVKKLLVFSDILKRSMQSNPMALNNYTKYLVQQFEKNGLVEVSEHIALSLLNDNKCIIDRKTLPLLEQYKKMALGNTVPALILHNQPKHKTSAEIKSKYQVIVFGASWCEACKTDIPQLKEYAEMFKTKYDAEIIFISIDTKEEEFINFKKDFPFISSCDFKGWEGDNVKNYYVFATPTLIVLDSKRKIVAKPNNAITAAKWLYENSQK